MKKLFEQIMKFGIVGVLAFLVDFGVYTILNFIFEKAGLASVFSGYYLVSQFFSFIVSMIFNYVLSMKYVFERDENMSRKKEFTIFFVLSVIGLVINEIILYIGVDMVYANWKWLQGWMSSGFAKTFFKLFATGVVMVYNFISRKIFLEKK
jgi:putative flippase GtrA